MILLPQLTNINELPVVNEVFKISQSLAILDAILMPEWEFRYFSFNRNWDTNQSMTSLRDGEGSHYYILFEYENGLTNCLGKIYCKDFLDNNLCNNNVSKMKNIINFKYFLNEVAFENDKATLYFFFDYSHDNWKSIATIENIPFLGIFKEKENAYVHWVEKYYEIDVDESVVKEIFEFKPLNEAMISKLNSQVTLQDILEDIKEIGYPYEES